MGSINTAGTNSGRDFTYGASPLMQENFAELFDETLRKLDALYQISDQTTFKIELNKLRKKMNRLITHYFNDSLTSLSDISDYKIVAKHYMSDIKEIQKKLEL